MLPDVCRYRTVVDLWLIEKQELEECFNLYPNKMAIAILFVFVYFRKRFGPTSADPQIGGKLDVLVRVKSMKAAFNHSW